MGLHLPDHGVVAVFVAELEIRSSAYSSTDH